MRRLCAVAALCVLFAAVPAAQAANLVPNAGFESDCSGTPCQWAPFGSPTAPVIATDPSTKHAGSFSLRVQAGMSLTGAASTACVGIAPGTYSSGFWFRTTDPNALTVQIAANTYNGQCDFFHFAGFPFGATKTLSDADRDGAWHFVSGPIDLSSGTVAQFAVLVQCDACPATVNFDDVSIDAAPTAVTVSSFAARRSGRDVVVRWRTGSEAGVLGFRLYRGRRLVTPSLVVAHGGPGGHAYRFRDRRVPKSPQAVYRLEIERIDGVSQAGPLPLGP